MSIHTRLYDGGAAAGGSRNCLGGIFRRADRKKKKQEKENGYEAMGNEPGDVLWHGCWRVFPGVHQYHPIHGDASLAWLSACA